MTDRVAMVRLIAGPDKSDTNTCDAYEATYQVSTFHSPGPDIDDRIADDGARIDRRLVESVLVALESDILWVARSSQTVEEGAALVATRRDVTVGFRIDSSFL